MPSISLPPLVIRNSLGIGQDGVYDSNRATARGLKIKTPWAPSPPSTFCQLKVITSSFSQGISMANTAEVASQMVKPCRSAAIQSPLGTFTPEVVPFQVKITS